jgi:hypothetical protein
VGSDRAGYMGSIIGVNELGSGRRARAHAHSRGRARRRSLAVIASSLLAKATAGAAGRHPGRGNWGIESTDRSTGVRRTIGSGLWGRTYCTYAFRVVKTKTLWR